MKLFFYFLRHYQELCTAPRQMLDNDLMMDVARIRYLAGLPSGQGVVGRILPSLRFATPSCIF